MGSLVGGCVLPRQWVFETGKIEVAVGREEATYTACRC